VTARPRVRRESTPVDDAPNAASAVATMLAVDAPRVGVGMGVADEATEDVAQAVVAADALDVVPASEIAVVDAEAAAVEVVDVVEVFGAAEPVAAEPVLECAVDAAAGPVAEIQVAETQVAENQVAEVEAPLATVEIEESIDQAVALDMEAGPAIEAVIAEPETLCSAEGDFVTHEAQDVHELQYDRVVEVTHAATEALPQELEQELDAESDDQSLSLEAGDSAVDMSGSVIIEVPPANDRALDTMSLFAGIAEERWMRLGDSTAPSRQS